MFWRVRRLRREAIFPNFFQPVRIEFAALILTDQPGWFGDYAIRRLFRRSKCTPFTDKKWIATMRISSRGQVTIPARIREQAGLLPNAEVEFAYGGRGRIRLFRSRRRAKKKSRGEALIEHMRGKGDIRMTTEQIMALTRGA